MNKLIPAALAAVLLLPACSSPDGGSDSGGSSLPSVDWSQYSPVVKKRIDRLRAKGRCPQLQQEFNAADANGPDGENADLMTYIDESLRQAGCY